MAAPATQTIDPVPPQLPEEEFWEKYNRRLEFPLSTVGTVFMHVMVAAGLFVVMNYLIAKPENKETVPISFAKISGEDDSGAGSDGDGKGDETIIMGSPQDKESESPTDPMPLPLPNPNQPTTNLPVPKLNSPSSTSAFPGKGSVGSGGKGPGGTGNEGKLARQENWNHWVISFSTFEGDGKDYLYQLGAFGAILVIPNGNQNHVYESLGRSFDGRVLSPTDTGKLTAGFHLFSEDPSLYSDPSRISKSRKTIQDVQRALRLDFTPEKFNVFFPKDVETLLTNKENAFILRVRSETQLKDFDLQSMTTIVFAVDRKSGGKEVDVVRASLKDGGRITVQNGRITVGR